MGGGSGTGTRYSLDPTPVVPRTRLRTFGVRGCLDPVHGLVGEEQAVGFFFANPPCVRRHNAAGCNDPAEHLGGQRLAVVRD
jgi:hypothetical protein